MDQSDRLRETITNNPIASRSSKDGEKFVREASIKSVLKLKQNYPLLKIIHRIEPNTYCRCGCNEILITQSKNAKHSDGHCQAGCGNTKSQKNFCSKQCKINGKYLAPTSLSQSEINKKLSIDFNDSELEIVRYGGAGISPDGGIVFIILPKSKTMLIIGVVEHKYQGTNEKRAAEHAAKIVAGEPITEYKNQSCGNAFERSYKNLHVIANYMRGENITPYHIYIHGCDFEDPESTISDRATSMTNNNIFSRDLSLNNKDIHGEISRRGSVFELWKLSEEQIIDVIYNMYETSIQYYLNKYAGEFDDSTG